MGRAVSIDKSDTKGDQATRAECFMMRAGEDEMTTVDEVEEQLKSFDLQHIRDVGTAENIRSIL